MPPVSCPLPAELERLFLGSGPEEEVLALEQHLLQCDSCLETLKTLLGGQEHLVGLLRGQPPADPFRDSPVVANLLQSLQSLRTPPAPAAGSANADERTMPPEPAGAAGSPATPFPLSQLESIPDTVSPGAGPDPSLTEFLSPPQAGDELGRLGKYRILKVLGHGGMGVVYQAEDPLLKRAVAVKAMLPGLAASASAGKRFLREAQAMAAVKHDHIVTIYQVDADRGVPYLAMEFLAGEALERRLQREPRLPSAEVLRIGREIAAALAAAHATGLIHRDVKPGNVWLEQRSSPLSPRGRGVGGEGPRVKLLDFGLARAAAQEAGLTQQGAIVGTPAYMAPEQGRGDPVDARSDLFSLGVVLYQLCSGRLPFQGRDTISTLMQVAQHQPAPPIQLNPTLPPELSDLVMRLLEKDPNGRPGTAAEVVQALQALEKKGARANDHAEATAAPTFAPAKRRRRPLLIAALVLLGLIGAAALVLIRFSTDPGDYVIKTDDPLFSFRVNKAGGVTLTDHKARREYALNVVRHEEGEFELEATDEAADLTFKSKTFTIKRGRQVALQAWFERKPGPGKQPPIAAAWFAEVANLPADKQVAAVLAKLKERNPDFNGKESHQEEDGVVTGLRFSPQHVTDLSPVRALTGLRALNCSGTDAAGGPLADLAPLQGLKLTSLDCSGTQVSDLKPLRDMPLTFLDCSKTPVSDLAPLQGLALTTLFIGGTKVADLRPLKDMRLTTLHCWRTPVSDLAPLKDMKLTDLDCHGTQVSSLAPLKDMKLTDLDCHGTQVSSLEPLQDMKLRGLSCDETQVSDLKPLREMRLLALSCSVTQVSSLEPLKEMKLTELHCSGTQVADLAPLAGMNLKVLWCQDTQVANLSPLQGMPLQELSCDFKPERDGKVLRSLKKTLEKVNGKPAEEFWKDMEAAKQPIPAAWFAEVAGLPADKQAEAVADKLMERNPDFDGKLTHRNTDGVVTDLEFLTHHVSDLAPLRALPGLRKLKCVGTPDRPGQLADLGPLRGLQLTELYCFFNDVSDLTPLQDLNLAVLDCGCTKVSDLTPLKSMRLGKLWIPRTPVSDLTPLHDNKSLLDLDCHETRVRDLGPLQGLQLTALDCGNTSVSDLVPLKGMRLKELWCYCTAVSDLRPLQGMPLKDLNLDQTRVSEWSPIKGLKLEKLRCRGTPVSDLSVLKDMPLREIHCHFVPERDTDALRALKKTLEKINDQPAEEFWKKLEAGKP